VASPPVAPQDRASVTVVGNGRNWLTSVTGSTNSWFDTGNWKIASGRIFAREEKLAGAAACVIGETVRSEIFGGTAGQTGLVAQLASAYDHDDAHFRVLTMVVMAGSLTVAAGIAPFFATKSLLMLIIGYVMMRLTVVVLWLRAAQGDPTRCKTARTYALGIALVQLYWIGLMPFQPMPVGWLIGALLLGWVLELAVPAVAERNGTTPWHRHHIMERYGLLTIIVLGETLLAATAALTRAAGDHFDIRFVHIALSALVITLSMWWLYFSSEEHLSKVSLSHTLTWAYGHAPLFAAGAAVGAGFAVMVDVVGGHATLTLLAGDYTVAVPAAIYLLALWFVRDRFVLAGTWHWVLPVFAMVVLLAPLVFGLEAVAAVMALCVVARTRASRGNALGGPAH